MRWVGIDMTNLLAILFGLLTSFAFEPVALWPFALIGFFGLFWLLNKSNLTQRLFSAYLFGLTFLLTVQHWTRQHQLETYKLQKKLPVVSDIEKKSRS